MALLTSSERDSFVTSHPGWAVGSTSMSRVFEFSDFAAAMGFVTSVALAAERAWHHPDIDIRWNTVTLTMTTHDEGGLTQKDIDLAIRIDSLR